MHLKITSISPVGLTRHLDRLTGVLGVLRTRTRSKSQLGFSECAKVCSDKNRPGGGSLISMTFRVSKLKRLQTRQDPFMYIAPSCLLKDGFLDVPII